MSQDQYLEDIAWTERPALSLVDALVAAGVPLVARPLNEDSPAATEVPVAWEAERFRLGAVWSGFSSFAEEFSEASLPGSERTKLSTLSYFLTQEQDALGRSTGFVRLELGVRVEKYAANGSYRGSGEIGVHSWVAGNEAPDVATMEIDAEDVGELVARAQVSAGFATVLDAQATSALLRRSGS